MFVILHYHSGMISLNEEQRRKIEENRAAAILKKQQSVKKICCETNTHNLTWKENNGSQNFNGSKFKTKNDFKIKSETAFLPATFKYFKDDRFIVEMQYHGPSIEVFKTIPGKKYEADLRKWSFPLTEQSNLVSKLKSLSTEIVPNSIPDPVVKILLSEDPKLEQVDWSRIDKTLRNFLMPFQVDGIRFGISKKGRCLIADDMGLGKTIQALGIAHYFKENWPLLIVCPSSMRYPWQDAIKEFLPSVKETILVLTTGKDCIADAKIVITSYDLMKNFCDDLIKKRFGVMIFDESHSLKSAKTARTKVALQLARTARNIILLSGTPALSRPQELYSQIFAIDPFTFKTFYDFGIRYCDGKKDKFGWNFSGSSNLEELELYMRKKIMIRRLKSEVIKQLPSKIRKLVLLHPNMIKAITKQIQRLESEYTNQKGAEKHSTLLSYYSVTGNAKLNAVCEYIEDKLENENKFLVFAHHTSVLNGICDLLIKKKVEYIRIDGSVSPEMRKTFCDQFQTQDNCRVAVLSIKAANSGITLTAAQLVIFAELYWNPGELTQAEDRAHRIGQQDSVLVEYLVAKGTADEHLWNLIQSKLNILNKAGLSKDNFSNTNTEHLDDRHQPTITSMFQSATNSVDELFDKNDQFLATGMEDDDIFDSINLEEIENEYQINNKKRKLSSET